MKMNYEVTGVVTFISEDAQTKLGYVDPIPRVPHLCYKVKRSGNTVLYYNTGREYKIVYDFMIEKLYDTRDGIDKFPHLFL